MKIPLILTSIFLPFLLISQNVNVSNGNVFEGEPYLTTNPNNSQHLIVAWMGFLPSNGVVIKTKVSFDGGANWSSESTLPHAAATYSSADVSMDFDNSGNVFLSYIDYDASIDSGEVYVRKSIDGGLSWLSESQVIHAHADPGKYPVDRPWISIDKSGGTYEGNIYVTTMSPSVFGPLTPPFDPYFISSTNGGSSFNSWRYLDTLNWLSGDAIQQPMPTHDVSTSGVFHAVYPSYAPSQSPWARYILASSFDGGNSFNYNVVFNSTGAPTDPLAKKGYLLLCDPSDPNHLAFLYLDITHGDIDVFLRESVTEGATWTQPVRVNDDPISNNRMQDLVWGDFDSDGDLVVSWRDRRGGADSTYQASSEIWAAVKWKDSTNFSPNIRLSDTIVAYDPVLAQNGNDFMCINFVNDTLSAVWGDVRTGKLNIWFQRINPNGTILSTANISSEEIPQVVVYPNPSSDNITIHGENIEKVMLLDINGKLMHDSYASENRIMIMDLRTYSSGTYFLRVFTKEGVITQKLIKN